MPKPVVGSNPLGQGIYENPSIRFTIINENSSLHNIMSAHGPDAGLIVERVPQS